MLDITTLTQIFVLLVLATICILIYQLGIFTKIQLRQQKLPKMHLVYKSVRGRYEGDDEILREIRQDTWGSFKISKYFGIYYDDPIDADPTNCRSIIGIIVNQGQDNKILKFVQSHPEYQQAYTRPTKYYSFCLPLLCWISFLIASFKINKQLKIQRKINRNIRLSQCTLEIYNVVPRYSKIISVGALMENFQDFLLYDQRRGVDMGSPSKGGNYFTKFKKNS